MQDLSDKTILVTGASKGIGAAIVASLGAAGAHVIAHYGSDRAGAESATKAIAETRVKLIGADLGDKEQVKRLWREAVAWRDGIDVFVNNAGILHLKGGIEDDDETWDAVWDETLRVNVLAPARLMRDAVRHYLDTGGGMIVTISSWAAQRGPGNPALTTYAASKAAVMAATKSIARNYADRNILAYVVAPGVVRTRMSEDTAAAVGGEEVVTSTLAMGEWIPPEELASLVTFLATGSCRHLSGATLDVNGATYIR
ncbi:MAG: SDR family oxidoreductase [Alphaproteobacteria bacterium]|nr:SDR family oxidoreductase [Alphaproteobacteria bacterium]